MEPNLQEQISSDFQMTWKVIGETAEGVDQLRVVVDRGFANVSERLRQVEGRMRLTEEGFRGIIQAVTHENQDIRLGMAELRSRVEALERRPPAA